MKSVRERLGAEGGCAFSWPLFRQRMRSIVLASVLVVWIGAGCAGAAPPSHLYGYSSVLPLPELLSSGFDGAGAWTYLLPALAHSDADEGARLQLHVRQGRPATAGPISAVLYSDFTHSLQVSRDTRQFFGHALKLDSDSSGSWNLRFSAESVVREGVELTLPVRQNPHWKWGMLLSGWNVLSADQRVAAGVGRIDGARPQMQFDYSQVSSDVRSFRRTSFSGRGAALGIFTQGEAGPVSWQVAVRNLWSYERLDHVFLSDMRYTSHPVQTDADGELVRRPPGEGSWRYGKHTLRRPLHLTAELKLSLDEDRLQPRLRYNERGFSVGVAKTLSLGTLHANYYVDDGLLSAAWDSGALAAEVGTRLAYLGQLQSLDLRIGLMWVF